ncbi:hypothetical protein COU87_01045 [Candidatus Roizmanbacteria bacterium CG10_big_fil_rev_8_21_14_0_10_39_12]|uniref:Glycosyltransferase GT-D fold domain-containing protein n=1 Tax=Candidatus Roizmanbacteria bacterium CG10_big_fil_rev_8_21_14_0_10_39_12 TaxID=1974852 RepID=A0A2M8KQ96_9BACT|nr:MAG: hypothetical protein COY15_00115 [Candidatus Roizmanbacteria bacterium CG_4_10_14_0_2_um_filter_39_12]PJE62097.1 MAG: hypothetical protein COU87_01045 [Candidatus Roizmanbacteria bacterium CG10_big_fil_rev_8_21_14_0_10_39_12]
MNKLVKKITTFIIYGLIYDPRVFFGLITSYIIGTNPTVVKFFLRQDLLSVLMSGKSLIRFGDGEVMLMTGRDIYYQTTSLNLKNKLRTIIKNFTAKSSYILSIPTDAITAETDELKAKGRYRIWHLFRVFFALRMDNKMTYADAHLFYHQSTYVDLIKPLILDREIICISKAETQNKNFLDTLKQTASSVSSVITPATESFSQYTSLFEQILNLIKILPQPKKCLLLISAGPAGKVLAYHFAELGIQCLDLGHGMEIIGQNKDYSDRI